MSRRPPLASWATWLLRLLVVVVHVVVTAFFSIVAWFYATLTGSDLEIGLANYYKGWDARYRNFASAVCASIAFAFGVSLLSMLLSSWRPSSSHASGDDDDDAADLRAGHRALVRRVKALKLRCCGIFGSNSPYFEVLLTIRETFETAILSYQAHQLSARMSRSSLHRFTAVMLTINCWMHPLVHRLFPTQSTTRRLLLLLGDIVLDVINLIGIPTLLVLSYSTDYDSGTRGFPIINWYRDVWFVRAIYEFQTILLIQQSDLLVQFILAFSLLRSLTTIKTMLATTHATGTITPASCGAHSIVPPYKSATIMTRSVSSATLALRRQKNRIEAAMQALFFAWGIVILGSHLHAQSLPALSSCPLQLRPWWGAKPACALLIIDCHGLGITGRYDEVVIAADLDVIDPSYTQQITFRNCPSLDIPPQIAKFEKILALKIYNSTVASWTKDAALTNSHHPRLLRVFLVRTVFADGQLPAGLLQRDFPEHLVDIEVSVSNLRALPEDLDKIWRPHGIIAFEHSQFTAIPEVVYRLEPIQVSFVGNHLTTFPAALMASPMLFFVNLGDNPLGPLPPSSEIDDCGALIFLFLGGTNVSHLPLWVDTVITRSTSIIGRSGLYAAETPLCLELNAHTPSEEDESAEDQSLLLQGDHAWRWVDCAIPDPTRYPLDVDDASLGQ